MISLAYKMLIGNRASCIGIIFGIFLATLLIAQQSAIFLGVVSRSYRIVTDIPAPNIWVIDPATESEDKLRSLPIGYVDVVRSTPGVEWAVPLTTSMIPLITAKGTFDIGRIYGIDEATLIGAPSHLVEGNLLDLRREGAIIIDSYTATHTMGSKLPDGSIRPLKVGDSLEINHVNAVVVGITDLTPGFYPQPIIYTTLSQYQRFNPALSDRVEFILAKTRHGASLKQVLKAINEQQGLEALSREEIKDKMVSFFLKTGILINFGLSVALAIIIGFSIAGQIFYIMTLQNIMYYALIKAIGGNRWMLTKMILIQAAIVGAIGFSLGVGASILWGIAVKNTTLAFMFPWELLLFCFFIVLLICVGTALLSIQKVLRIDPKTLLGT